MVVAQFGLLKLLTGIPQRLFFENLWEPVELKQSVENRLAEQKPKVCVPNNGA